MIREKWNGIACMDEWKSHCWVHSNSGTLSMNKNPVKYGMAITKGKHCFLSFAEVKPCWTGLILFWMGDHLDNFPVVYSLGSQAGIVNINHAFHLYYKMLYVGWLSVDLNLTLRVFIQDAYFAVYFQFLLNSQFFLCLGAITINQFQEKYAFRNTQSLS